MFKKIGLVASVMTMGVACGGGGGGGGVDAPSSTLPACASGMNAFETYGSAAFVTVTKAIVANTLAEFGGSGGAAAGEANLGSAFTNIGNAAAGSDYADDGTAFTGRLAAFISLAYGGPTSTTVDGVSYDGEIDMKTAHAGMAITSAQYDYFVTNDIVPALTASGVTTADVTACFAPVVTDDTFKNTIINQ
jgi:hypothetical protein